MKTKAILRLVTVLFVIMTVPQYSASEQDTVRINTEFLQVDVVSTKSANKLPAYVGEGPAISFQSPFGGMSMIIGIKEDDGNAYSYFAGELTSKQGGMLVQVSCKIKNISQETQKFSVGDISLLSKDESIDFFAVGEGEYVFAKDEKSRNIVKKKEIKIEPNKEILMKYVYGVSKDNLPLKLSYKNKSVEIKLKE